MGRHSAVVVPVLVTHSQLMFPWKTVENDKKKPKKKNLSIRREILLTCIESKFGLKSTTTY
jgi:hypothetical protein